LAVGTANPGRVAAVRALSDVDEGAHAEDALSRYAPRRADDRGLAWFLTMGVLRHRSHVDAALRPFAARPIGSLDAQVRAALRMGAFEILYARTAPHAIVHQAVEAVGAAGAARAGGMVNAILRKVKAPEGLSRAEELDHPDWLVERWTARYGGEATDRWCRANAEPPPLGIAVKDDALFHELKDGGHDVQPIELGGETLRRAFRIIGHGGAIVDLRGFRDGRFWVQDPASVLVADLLGDVSGKRVLDACAAPGGKTFRLASRGAFVTATEKDRGRLSLLEESAGRLKFRVDTALVDWTAGDVPGGIPAGMADKFDAVLVDAPCTALGLVRRHPEIRWRRRPDDVRTIPATQRAVLDAASRCCKPGGTLVYAVCSPEPEEGTEVVSAFLAEHPEFTLERTFTTAPPQNDEDAFFAARLARTGR
jgi:16S rRNA (cytosine967-C5)-methyltransferase